MCGIALIISGTRIDLSSLLLDSVPSASSTSIDDQVGFSSFNFYCYILNSCLSNFFSFLYLENKNLILTMCHEVVHNLIRLLDPPKKSGAIKNMYQNSVLVGFFLNVRY